MQPEFEDLVYGTDLRDGMIVLVEDEMMRGDPSRSSDTALVLSSNRWCTVSRLQVIDRGFGQSPLVKFIGVYGDGMKRSRTYDSGYGWIIKRESM
jgi:hypothetical protein